jgi:Uma2 family endonuclease
MPFTRGMAEAAETLAVTVDDYMGMPPGPPYYQLIEGDLYVSPSQHWRHQDILLNLAVINREYLAKNPIGKVMVAPMDVCLNEINVYQPDVLFFSHERGAILGKRCIEGAPDFLVEILSESTAHLDKGPKRKIYARTGVKELWLIDPESKDVTIFDLGNSAERPRACYGENDSFVSAIFPGLTFKCAEIFRGV